MHARIEHLLSVRDAEPVDAGIAEHIGQCPACSAKLRRLVLTREQLSALPLLEPPRSSWEQIQLQVARSGASRGRRAAGAVAAALAIVTLSVIAAVAIRQDRTSSPQQQGAQSIQQAPDRPTPDAAELAQLMVQSQRLDHLLQTLPQRPHVERVSTAATIDTIEQRIQWLDYRLSDAPDSGLNQAQAHRLWHERVELMDSLVKVRYAEAGRAGF